MRGKTVVWVTHNPEVIKSLDHVVDVSRDDGV